MRIIVDAFGGDNAPVEILKGAAKAVATYDCDIILTGDEEKIRQAAAGSRTDRSCTVCKAGN